MNAVATPWRRVPVLVRAPIAAMAVLVAAVYPTSFLLQLNLHVLPGLPWAVVPGAAYLTLLWRYIGGWGPPAASAGERERYRRFRPLRSAGRAWVWVSGAALGATISGFTMIKLMTESGGVQQTALLDALAPLPATTVLPLLAMMVGMTAFFEEAAFRGHMQVRLEERYRPWLAVFLTALLFAAVHSPAPGQLPLFVFGSLGWGVLAYLSGSIVPTVVVHGAVDGAMFLWVWMRPDAFRSLLERNVLQTGVDGPFEAWVAIAVVGTAATIFGLVRLSRRRARTS